MNRGRTVSLFAVATLGVVKCSAFVLTPSLATFHPHKSIAKSICTEKNNKPLQVENGESDNDAASSFLSSLPSPDAVKENTLEGKFGERGEQYVMAQFSLFVFIALGTVPIVGDFITPFLGPSFILVGLILVYKAATDLKNNLSPWPAPTDPKSGRGSLIDGGIYSYVRHPMYSGVLFGMFGLSLLTDSVVRMLLTLTLYFVLDAKSDFEEEKLIETYGAQYEGYRNEVKGKFLPLDLHMFKK